MMMQFNIIFTVMSLMMSSVMMMMSFACGKCSSHGSVIESCCEVRI